MHSLVSDFSQSRKSAEQRASAAKQAHHAAEQRLLDAEEHYGASNGSDKALRQVQAAEADVNRAALDVRVSARALDEHDARYRSANAATLAAAIAEQPTEIPIDTLRSFVARAREIDRQLCELHAEVTAETARVNAGRRTAWELATLASGRTTSPPEPIDLADVGAALALAVSEQRTHRPSYLSSDPPRYPLPEHLVAYVPPPNHHPAPGEALGRVTAQLRNDHLTRGQRMLDRVTEGK